MTDLFGTPAPADSAPASPAGDRLHFFWFLPTSGDGPYIGSSEGNRPPGADYLGLVA